MLLLILFADLVMGEYAGLAGQFDGHGSPRNPCLPNWGSKLSGWIFVILVFFVDLIAGGPPQGRPAQLFGLLVRSDTAAKAAQSKARTEGPKGWNSWLRQNIELGGRRAHLTRRPAAG